MWRTPVPVFTCITNEYQAGVAPVSRRSWMIMEAMGRPPMSCLRLERSRIPGARTTAIGAPGPPPPAGRPRHAAPSPRSRRTGAA
ncbi:hypothetical protein GCM10010964_14540 [Caldovatus sediminis]|uniref:Uncharacterized protein n=1 Tax=Caldovatus sediminis TaxID=2041189 RepID=A0A8J2Z9L2_9PROT|nr:hypothetical protein GCM10010964_14540 [Caldovatus sediminis]